MIEPQLLVWALCAFAVAYFAVGAVLVARWMKQATIDNGGSPLRGVEGEYRMRMILVVLVSVAAIGFLWPAVLVIRFLFGLGRQLAGGL
jgi:hypothetical protein